MVKFRAGALQKHVARDAVASGFAQLQTDIHAQLLVFTRVLEVGLSLFTEIKKRVHACYTTTHQHAHCHCEVVDFHL